MSNHEYHQRYMEAMMKLADNPEHKDGCAHWKGGECSCDPDVTAEDASLNEQES